MTIKKPKRFLFPREELMEMLYKECDETPDDSPDSAADKRYKIIVARLLDLILFRTGLILFLASLVFGSVFTTLVLRLIR